jgi:hypothetical protein
MIRRRPSRLNGNEGIVQHLQAAVIPLVITNIKKTAGVAQAAQRGGSISRDFRRQAFDWVDYHLRLFRPSSQKGANMCQALWT